MASMLIPIPHYTKVSGWDDMSLSQVVTGHTTGHLGRLPKMSTWC